MTENGETQVVQYGHKFDCDNHPEICSHERYSDADRVELWDHHFHADDPHGLTSINGHPVVTVKRIVTYGPWVPDNGSDEDQE